MLFRKKILGGISISLVDPTGYYQKLTQTNGLVPYVHVFEVSNQYEKELGKILKEKDYLNGYGVFGLQRQLSVIDKNSGKVTEDVIVPINIDKGGDGFQHFSNAIEFATFSSTRQLGHYVYLGDCELLKNVVAPEIVECIKKERVLRSNHTSYFEKTNYQHSKSLKNNKQQEVGVLEK
ncbi:MAG: hypothetical protein IC227_06040 [Enterococcus lacertideformus]|uniref:Uncharacterized protein n=1 Tax=Enterococcus lacertideformus TaxID=2771493 RepID=A0A931FCQ5_9ENTE|nr:hypothetical protein [Enterococcus lacertideformus]